MAGSLAVKNPHPQTATDDAGGGQADLRRGTRIGPSAKPWTAQVPGASLTGWIRGSGPALVLIHGSGGTVRAWDRVAEDLGRDHTVVAVDLPGHGGSKNLSGDNSLGAAATAIRDALAVLGVHRATIVGHSLGGVVALHFAYQFPERCERLVLVDPGGLGPEVPLALRALALPGAGLVLETRRHLIGGLARLGVLSGLEHHARPGVDDLRCRLAQMRSVIGRGGQQVDASTVLSTLSRMLPVLVVWGRDDRVLPVRQGIAAKELAPAVELVLIEGAGHSPHVDSPPPSAPPCAVSSVGPIRS